MKFISLTHIDVQSLISDNFNISVELKYGNYSSFNLNNITYITYCSLKLSLDNPQGFVILEKRDSIWYLFPTVIQLIKLVNEIKIHDEEKINLITKSNPIEFHAPNQLAKLLDKHDRIIALVKIDNNVLNPIVDIGYYLRSESY